jgi:murein DD-endopeptidase MepM/ murein hydrolase activator NlpD
MKNKTFLPIVATLFLVLFASVGSAFAGFLQFPIQGYTSSTAPVTAVMDHDDNWYTIETYTGETGTYQDGCLAYVNGENTTCSGNGAYPWGYARENQTPWSILGLNYIDYAPGNNVYMWYDNHHGYDFAVQQWTPVRAAASGYVSDYNSSWGQITIDHDNGYQTIYTHMYINQCLPYVSKGTIIGYVSNVAPEPVGVHLHFVVKKWGELVDPYGGSGEPVLWE